jgi:hypothetical protein
MPIIGCTENPSPEEVIAKAHAAADELQSYRVKTETIITEAEQTSKSISEMEVVASNRSHCKTYEDKGWTESIAIGDAIYSRDSEETQWRVRNIPLSEHGVSMSSTWLFSMEGMFRFFNSLTDLKGLSREQIDDVDCFRYWGRVDMDRAVEKQKAQLDPSTPGYEDILKSLEFQRQQKIEAEFWIGKEDYLIRQVKLDMEIPQTESTSEAEWSTLTSLTKYRDFNEPIEIEPPQAGPGEGAYLGCSMSGSHGAEGMQWRISIHNRGFGAALNVRVFINNLPTTAEGLEVVEAQPSTTQPVNLDPGDSETYYATWEHDLDKFPDPKMGKEQLRKLQREMAIRIQWETPEGEVKERIVLPYSVTHEGK